MEKFEAYPYWETRLGKYMIILPALWGETKLTKIVREILCLITVIRPKN
jgi:hypothetical protein